ncbi:MAG: hypothetical protein LBV02_09265 [Bacteroidales bacterium]|jgi:hypothetical protein|nr:hypothetical protein [Bacteroidales bacterium]
MKKILSVIAGMLFIFNSFAQLSNEGTPEFERLFTVTIEEDSLYKKDGIFGLLSSIMREYKFNAEGNFELHLTGHRIYKFYDPVKIKGYNKLEFPKSVVENLLACEGQLIRNGKVVSKLTKKDLVTVDVDEDLDDEENEEDGEEEKNEALIFDDAQPGDMVEFYFVRKLGSVYESGRFSMQDDFALKNVTFQLIMPSHLKADMRLYNADEVPVDSVSEQDQKRFTTVFIPSVKALKEESTSFWLPNAVCVDYVLAYNYGARKQRFNTIAEYGVNLYNMINTVSKADKKVLKKIKSEIKIDKSMSEEEKIRTIENSIKEKYGTLQLYYDALSTIEGLDQYGFGNTRAYLRLYYQLFDQYGIANEIVSTSDRTRITFDPDFDSQSNLEEYIFYFPRIDKYMSPDINSLRLGLIPDNLIGQHAVFFEPTTMGSVSTYLHEIKQLPVPGKEITGDTLRVNVSINPEQELVNAHVYRAITGYNTPFLQANYNDLTAEGKEFMLNHYLALDDDNNVVRNEVFRNYESGDVGVKPFVLEADFTSAALTTQAQNGFDLKVGELIGKQGEYKQEGERQLPVQTANNKHYYRVLTIQIPEGYVCEDLDDFNYEVYDRDDKSKATAGFTVETRRDGNTITIVCTEYYESIYYPSYEHTGYGRVINAAFDFNRMKMKFTAQ